MRNSKIANMWRRYVCKKDNAIHTICCNNCRAFLDCGNGDDNFSDGNGSTYPQFGMVLFDSDASQTQKVMEQKPQWIRLDCPRGVNKDIIRSMVWTYRNKGVNVILVIFDKNSTYNGTIEWLKELLYEYKNHITYQIYNEPNNPNLYPNSYLEPNMYGNLLSDCYHIIKDECDARVLGAGIASDTHYKMKSWEYVDKVGGAWQYCDKVALQIYNKGNDNFYRIRDAFKKHTHAGLWCTEFGCGNTDEQKKIEAYNDQMNRFMRNYVETAIYYAFGNGEPFTANNKPLLWEHMKTAYRL